MPAPISPMSVKSDAASSRMSDRRRERLQRILDRENESKRVKMASIRSGRNITTASRRTGPTDKDDRRSVSCTPIPENKVVEMRDAATDVDLDKILTPTRSRSVGTARSQTTNADTSRTSSRRESVHQEWFEVAQYQDFIALKEKKEREERALSQKLKMKLELDKQVEEKKKEKDVERQREKEFHDLQMKLVEAEDRKQLEKEELVRRNAERAVEAQMEQLQEERERKRMEKERQLREDRTMADRLVEEAQAEAAREAKRKAVEKMRSESLAKEFVKQREAKEKHRQAERDYELKLYKEGLARQAKMEQEREEGLRKIYEKQRIIEGIAAKQKNAQDEAAMKDEERARKYQEEYQRRVMEAELSKEEKHKEDIHTMKEVLRKQIADREEKRKQEIADAMKQAQIFHENALAAERDDRAREMARRNANLKNRKEIERQIRMKKRSKDMERRGYGMSKLERVLNTNMLNKIHMVKPVMESEFRKLEKRPGTGESVASTLPAELIERANEVDHQLTEKEMKMLARKLSRK